MEQEELFFQEVYELAKIMDHLRSFSVLLKNFDCEYDADESEIQPLSASIRHLGKGLLDIDPNYYLEHDLLVGSRI